MALPQPKGKQLEVLDLKPEGHNVVLGTAGSGKTTLAIYRAIYLATLDDKEKVMLVTFNTTLVKYLEAIVGSEIPRNIEVRNYHKFARGYLAHRNKMPRWNGIVSGMEDGDNKKQLFVRRALENVKAVNGTNSTLKRAEEVFLEEINWIEKMGIKTLDEYEKVERVGRFDTRIIRENRKYFFQVYKAYLEVRKEEGYLYDWEDIAQTVCEELENDTEKRMYKHIIVDEGQDLSPIMLKSLVKAIPEDGTFTFFGDVAQQIYGSRLQGICQGGQPIMSYNYGAGNRDRVKKAFFTQFTICTIFTGCFWLIMLLFPKIFAGIFSNNTELITYTAWALRIYMAGIFSLGFQVACQQSFMALGQAKVSLLLACLRKLILLIPLIFILPHFIQNKVFAVFLAEPISDILAAIITTSTFFSRFNKILDRK